GGVQRSGARARGLPALVPPPAMDQPRVLGADPVGRTGAPLFAWRGPGGVDAAHLGRPARACGCRTPPPDRAFPGDPAQGGAVVARCEHRLFPDLLAAAAARGRGPARTSARVLHVAGIPARTGGYAMIRRTALAWLAAVSAVLLPVAVAAGEAPLLHAMVSDPAALPRDASHRLYGVPPPGASVLGELGCRP